MIKGQMLYCITWFFSANKSYIIKHAIAWSQGHFQNSLEIARDVLEHIIFKTHENVFEIFRNLLKPILTTKQHCRKQFENIWKVTCTCNISDVVGG